MESTWTTGKRFLQIHARRWSHYKYSEKGICPFMTRNTAGDAPALIRTGKPVAREDERIESTIPMPTFARRPPTMGSFFPVDSLQS